MAVAVGPLMMSNLLAHVKPAASYDRVQYAFRFKILLHQTLVNSPQAEADKWAANGANYFLFRLAGL
jgi:hypothetical protein